MAPSLGSPKQPAAATGKKRTRDETAEEPELKATTAKPDESSKKAKKRKRAKKVSEDAAYSSIVDGIDEAIGKMDGRLLADFFAKKAKRHDKDLTAVELDDIFVPEYSFLDTSSWQGKRSLENMPSFLKSHSPKKGSVLSTASETNGSPHTIVITLAGLRAADITRALRQFQNKDSAVAKLFAKHIKLDEARETVKKTRMGIGIGTPVRLTDLVDSGDLKLDALKRIVIDGSYVDAKKRGIFDMKDLHLPLLRFLNRPDLRERYSSTDSKVRILVF